MQGIFYFSLSLVIIGAIYETLHENAIKSHKRRFESRKTTPIRKWLAVREIENREIKIPVLVVDSGKKELAYYLNTVRDTPYETYDMSYSELLATVTPEEAQSINELKEFLK